MSVSSSDNFAASVIEVVCGWFRIIGAVAPGSTSEKPTLRATLGSFSLTELFNKYFPSVEILSAEKKLILKNWMPEVQTAGVQSENVI